MRNLFLFLILAASAVAEVRQTVWQPAWQHQLPESGLTPSAFSVEIMTEMSERHGGNCDFSMSKACLAIPLSDPRKSSVYGWAFCASLDAKFAFIDSCGDFELRHDTLCELTLPLSVIRSEENGNRLILAIAPMLATDFDAIGRGFDMGAVASYTVKHSENFSYSLGVGLAPRMTRYCAVPFVGFEWKLPQDWTLTLRGYRFEALHAFSDRLSVGPFVSGMGGTWAVDTDDGTRVLRVKSLVLGLAGQYDFSAEGQNKRLITAEVGTSLATSARFYRRGTSSHSEEAHHYHPGFVISLGIDCRF